MAAADHWLIVKSVNLNLFLLFLSLIYLNMNYILGF